MAENNSDPRRNPDFDFVHILRNRGFAGLGNSFPEDDPIISANQIMSSTKKPTIISKIPTLTVTCENDSVQNTDADQPTLTFETITVPSESLPPPPRFGRAQIREYYAVTEDSEHPSYWAPMEFCGRIQGRGKKMILAAFLSDTGYSPTQIADAFTNHHYSHLTFATGELCKCNANDILKAVAYMVMVGYDWHLRYNADNKRDWEENEDAMREINGWVKELEKGIPKGDQKG